mgnify:CR=1 FL=1
MNRRDVLRSLVGVGALGGMGTVDLLAAAGSPATKTTVTSAKNLVIVVNMLGYNRHTFHPKGDDLDKSPLLARLKAAGERTAAQVAALGGCPLGRRDTHTAGRPLGHRCQRQSLACGQPE